MFTQDEQVPLIFCGGFSNSTAFTLRFLSFSHSSTEEQDLDGELVQSQTLNEGCKGPKPGDIPANHEEENDNDSKVSKAKTASKNNRELSDLAEQFIACLERTLPK